MKKSNAVLFSVHPSVNAEGCTEYNPVRRAELKGVMIPVNSELAGKSFGYDENISYRFFTKNHSEFIVAGNILRYENRDYSIVHIADYGRMQVIHLNTLIGRNNVRSVVQSIRY